ncbi:MAG: hypothetical protein HY654_03020 [Acidobacteria bacterium]|nr:hypothetical protein [Acidobacteriota bacterium]
MKNITIGLCLAGLIGFAGAIAAQTANPQKPAYPPTATATEEKTVTLTGCLQKGERPNTWVLKNVTGDTAAVFGTMKPAEPGKPAGTAGTAALSVTLQPAAGVNLAEHVGHTVEITGMVVPQGRQPKKEDDQAAGPTVPPAIPGATPPSANPAGANPVNPPAATPAIPPAGDPAARPADPQVPADAAAIGTSGAKREHRVNVKTITHKAEKC